MANAGETRGCNVKVQHIRPKYANLRTWCEDPQNVYIGRAGVVFIDGQRYPKQASVWANPFKIDKESMTRKEVCARYEAHIQEKLESDPDLVLALLGLKGKQLGCWCVPEACHGDVLVRLIAQYD